MTRMQDLETRPIGKLLMQYSIPAVVGIMVMSLYNVIGRIFIGQGVGPDAIAGLAITFPVMNVSAAFGVLIGVGSSARVSVLLGAGEHREAEMVLGNSIVMTLLFGTIYIGIFALLLDPILRLFGASDTSLPYAHDYMVWLLPGLLINNICYSFNNVMRATGYPTKAMVTMFIGAGLSVVLCPLFIFGFKMGIKGAAIATDISMGVSALFVLLHFFDKRSHIHFTPGTYRLSRRVLIPIVAIGAAPCIVNTAGCLVNAIINNTVYRYGGDASVAAIGIFTTLTQMFISFVIGVCQGMQPIVGYNYGARRYDRLKRAFWLTAAVCTAACALCTFAGMVLPRYVARLFTADKPLLDAAEYALRHTTWMFWCVGFQIVVTNFLQSLGEAGKAIWLSLSRQVLFLIPLLFTLPSVWGLAGVWLSFPIGDIFAFAVACVMLWLVMSQITNLVNTTRAEAA